MEHLAKAPNILEKCNFPITYKIVALDAIVRSKLIYGTDAPQLNEPDLKRMEKIPSTRNEKHYPMGHNNSSTEKIPMQNYT